MVLSPIGVQWTGKRRIDMTKLKKPFNTCCDMHAAGGDPNDVCEPMKED
jgi:hypothetical protein